MRGSTVLPGTSQENGSDPGVGGLPIHRLEVPMPNTLPFAIGTFDTIGPMSRASFPHRHTFHEIVLVTGGTGSHVVDLTRFTLRPPHLCFIAPGQVHYWDGVRGLEGCVVVFTDDFLLEHPADRALLRRLGRRPWLELPERDADWAARLVAEMDHEYRTGAEGFGVARLVGVGFALADADFEGFGCFAPGDFQRQTLKGYAKRHYTKAEIEANPATMAPGNNLARVEWNPQPEYVSAGLPTSDAITVDMRGYYAFNYNRHTHAITRTTPAVSSPPASTPMETAYHG